MKLVKSLLLGSAAGLAAVAGANAADLPAKKVAAVEYVRVCSTYGAGFFYIPGTETCLRVGGRVRADAVYLEPNTRDDDTIGFRARGRLNIDARTATAYGLLRTYIRYEITQSSGSPFGSTGSVGTSADVAQAFVQFGGLTAGKVTSFFSNPDLPTQHMGSLRFDDAPDIALFAYTFSFGNGFSATISAEDGYARRNFGRGLIVVDPIDPGFVDTIVYGGQTVPDVVANVRYAGTWGSAQLSGAVHQLRDISPLVDTEYGFAIGASASVNLPTLGAGDAFWVSGAYSQGASNYSGFGGASSIRPLGGGGFGNFNGIPDAVIGFDGSINKTEVWNIAAGFTHYWGPTLRSSIFGSYASVEFGSGSIVTGGGFLLGAIPDFNEWRIGANTFWTPVSGLNFGLEVIYADADLSGAAGAFSEAVLGRDLGAIEGRIRVQRDF